jgi:hypothetical protein
MQFQHTTPIPSGATSYDVLSFTGPISGGVQAYTYTISKPLRSYDNVLIEVIPNGNTPLCATVTNGSVIFCSPFHNTPTASSVYQTVVPCVNNPGDIIKATVWVSSSTAPTSVTLYGTIGMDRPLMRADGRTYPIGKLFADVGQGSSGNVIAAPPGVLRIFLFSLEINLLVVGGSRLQAANGTINGVFNSVGSIGVGTGSGGGTTFKCWPQGLLLDAATALVLAQADIGTISQASGSIQAMYDLVV